MSTFALTKKDPVRKILGDFVHINFYNLRKFALLSYSPKFAPELFKVSKLTGYYDGELGLISAELDKTKERLTRTGKFLDIFKKIMENGVDVKAYANLGCGIIAIKEMDVKKDRLVYTLDESTNYPVRSTKRLCYEDIGALCGISEAVTHRSFSGMETKCHCKGDNICEFELYPTKREEEPNIDQITSQEASGILDDLVEDIVHRRHTVNRKRLGDYTYIGYDQCMNYLITKTSEGHEVLSKYCGGQIGERIAKKTKLDDTKEILDYVKELFDWMRVGLLNVEVKKDKITIELKETIYSSGVKNINMKLDTFIAGIIEGALNQSTGYKWQINETKCLANGDNHCEFTCEITK